MPALTNTKQRYGAVAIVLHWTMAVLLVMLIGLGLYMVGLPDAGFDTLKINLILLHKELGILALCLVVPRFAWRLRSVIPSLGASIPEWQQVVARFVHLLFYACMFALPITGWLMSSATGIPVYFLGVPLPDLVPFSDRLFRGLVTTHRGLSYLLLALVLLHAGAAVLHHWVFRDETLKKMLPAGR